MNNCAVEGMQNSENSDVDKVDKVDAGRGRGRQKGTNPRGGHIQAWRAQTIEGETHSQKMLLRLHSWMHTWVHTCVHMWVGTGNGFAKMSGPNGRTRRPLLPASDAGLFSVHSCFPATSAATAATAATNETSVGYSGSGAPDSSKPPPRSSLLPCGRGDVCIHVC